MKGLSDIQRSGQAREEEANKLRKDAESKAADLERSLVEAKGEIAMLTHEKSSLKENLDANKQELLEADKLMDNLKREVDKMKSDVNNQMSKLQLEKELRARSDEKEQQERNERIALSAQMVAMTKDHAQIEAQLREANEALDCKWQEKLETQNHLFKLKDDELSEAMETIAGLEGEITSLKQALNEQKSIAHAKSAEEISRLKGEINVLKERMKLEEQRALSAGVASKEHVKKLESQIIECQSERRR